MSYFEKLAMEGADLGYENDAPLANGEETHTVANEIAEVQGLAQEAADAEEGAEKLDDEAAKTEELAENVEADVAAENVLDPTAAKFMRLAFKNIVGAKYADKKLPATESWSGSRAHARENTRIALEGIKDTLKSFWEAIKAQFKKVYNKVKSWIVKTFSAAKKLKERAESLQKKANDTVGTIEDKSFSFGQTKAIAVEGKYNDISSLTTGLHNLRIAVEGNATTTKKANVDDSVEGFVNNFKSSYSTSKSGKAFASASELADVGKSLADAMKATSEVPASVGDKEKYISQFGDSKEILVGFNGPLPGGKAIICIQPSKALLSKASGGEIEDLIKCYKAVGRRLAADKYTPREVSEGDVKTLTTSQIDKVCDDVIEIGESIYAYEKSWESREGMVNKIEKELDQIVKEFESDNEDNDKNNRVFRNFASATMGILRRDITFVGNICSYALVTGNAFLNYAERSLGQHKSK